MNTWVRNFNTAVRHLVLKKGRIVEDFFIGTLIVQVELDGAVDVRLLTEKYQRVERLGVVDVSYRVMARRIKEEMERQGKDHHWQTVEAQLRQIMGQPEEQYHAAK